jgi:hypothetical protein
VAETVVSTCGGCRSGIWPPRDQFYHSRRRDQFYHSNLEEGREMKFIYAWNVHEDDAPCGSANERFP